ncbi:hypothetical protein DH2020_049053 [Rehmannia glutinosa]|uniref:Uncharacterized protein n=1 Tax=Rehmannia glutinosa TaxID=99300 RepID=A0ABR0U3W5_REHGL
MMSRRSKIVEDTMKTMILTPNSSVKSSTTMEANPSETRDNSFYFPGCRKDANCNCEICIASINATLDLMPNSIHRSSLTKLSVSRPVIRRSPVSLPSSDLSTPKLSARIRSVNLSPPTSSTENTSFQEKKAKRRKKESGYGVFVVRFHLGLILVFGLEYGVSWMVSMVLKAKLSSDLVTNLGENSKNIEGINGKFYFLKNELEGLTAGLITADYSMRSFSIISGRVTEWSTGEADYFVRIANSSWTQKKWSSSVVQLDPNTWILEYRQSFLLENGKFVSTVMDFLKFRLTKAFEKLKQEFWLMSAFGSRHFDFTEGSITIPT